MISKTTASMQHTKFAEQG